MLATIFVVLDRAWALLKPFALPLAMILVGMVGAALWAYRDHTPKAIAWITGPSLKEQLVALKTADAAALKAAQAHNATVASLASGNGATAVQGELQANARVIASTQYLLKETHAYVTPQADRACPVPVGFVSLWDAASRGDAGPALAGPAAGVADAPSQTQLSGVSAAHTDDAGAYFACLDRVQALTSLWDKDQTTFNSTPFAKP